MMLTPSLIAACYPPTASSVGVPGDLASLIQTLGGNARVLGAYDVRSLSAGALATWPDARGAGFGPSFTGTAVVTSGALPVVQTIPASSHALATARDAKFDLSAAAGRSYVWIGYRDVGSAAGRTPFSVAGPMHTPAADLTSWDVTPPNGTGGASLDGLASGVMNATITETVTGSTDPVILPGGRIDHGPPPTSGPPRLLADGQPWVVALVRTPTQVAEWVYPSKYAPAAASPAASGAAALQVGGDATVSTFTASRTRAVLALTGVVSAADLAAIYLWAGTYHGTPTGTLLLTDGDSRTVFPDDAEWPWDVMQDPSVSGKVYGFINYAVGGRKAADIVSQYGTTLHVALAQAVGTFGQVIAVIWAGVNDTGTSSPQQAAADLLSVAASIRADGGKVILCTEVSSDRVGWDGPGGWKDTQNAILYATPSGYDGLADLRATAVGADNAYLDGTLFVDRVHPTAHGQTILAAVILASVRAVAHL